MVNKLHNKFSHLSVTSVLQGLSVNLGAVYIYTHLGYDPKKKSVYSLSM